MQTIKGKPLSSASSSERESSTLPNPIQPTPASHSDSMNTVQKPDQQCEDHQADLEANGGVFEGSYAAQLAKAAMGFGGVKERGGDGAQAHRKMAPLIWEECLEELPIVMELDFHKPQWFVDTQ